MPDQVWAVVDIGSNTVHLLVARVVESRLESLWDESAGLRLGQDVVRTGRIGREKLAGLVATLQRFQDLAAQAGAPRVHLLATHALRVAGNQAAVVQVITRATGLPVTVLTPETEAALGYRGAVAATPGPGLRLVVDVGGGSMQLVLGEGDRIAEARSLPLGAARLAGEYMPGDPPSAEQEAHLVSYLQEVIPPALPVPEGAVALAVGVGGALRGAAWLLGYAPGQVLPPDALDQVAGLLRGHSVAALIAGYGLEPVRAPLLLPAVLLLRQILAGYESPPLTISAYGLREGAILTLVQHATLDGGNLL